MKWITREKIKVDRVACPWLIRNFIDSDAEFVFLPHETDWAKIDNGIVFDVPNCELGHHGEDVSFNSILKKYKLPTRRWFCSAKLSEQPIRTRTTRIKPAKDCAGLPAGSVFFVSAMVNSAIYSPSLPVAFTRGGSVGRGE